LVEHRTENARVTSSSLVLGTILKQQQQASGRNGDRGLLRWAGVKNGQGVCGSGANTLAISQVPAVEGSIAYTI
jgi:hypothetical protein